MDKPLVDAYDLELKISKFLRAGTFFAVFLLGIGWLGQIFEGSNGLKPFATYAPSSLARNLHLIWEARQHFKMISYAGLLVLISLPVIRVLLTGILFLKQRETLIASIAFLVLIALLASFSLGIEL